MQNKTSILLTFQQNNSLILSESRNILNTLHMYKKKSFMVLPANWIILLIILNFYTIVAITNIYYFTSVLPARANTYTLCIFHSKLKPLLRFSLVIFRLKCCQTSTLLRVLTLCQWDWLENQKLQLLGKSTKAFLYGQHISFVVKFNNYSTFRAQ